MPSRPDAGSGLKDLLVGHLFPMLGAALLGAFFDWLLSLNLSRAPQVLHGGLWILMLGLLGLYLDYRSGLTRVPYLQGAPEIFIVFVFLLMNLAFAFWIVTILAGLGLGFDLSTVHIGLKWFLGFVSVVAVFIIGAELDSRGK